jgi:hypothetical protein
VAALLHPGVLDDFPGAPFPPAVVAAAAESVRKMAGWHIAPVQSDTVTVDGVRSRRLLLPTLRIVEVTEVRDVSADAPVVLNGWKVDNRRGWLYREEGWPCGPIEVDMAHGYHTCPADLLPLIAELAQWSMVNGAVSQQQAGPFLVSARDERSSSRQGTTQAVSNYTIRRGFW